MVEPTPLQRAQSGALAAYLLDHMPAISKAARLPVAPEPTPQGLLDAGRSVITHSDAGTLRACGHLASEVPLLAVYDTSRPSVVRCIACSPIDTITRRWGRAAPACFACGTTQDVASYLIARGIVLVVADVCVRHLRGVNA